VELELGDDAEVPSAAADAPEQIGVLVPAGLHKFSVGGDQIDGEELIDGQPVLSHQPSDSAAERQSGDAGVGDDPPRDREPECLRLAIELSDQYPGLRPDGLCLGIDPDALHQPEVDDDAAVADGQPGEAVAAAAHGRLEARPAREPQRRDDVRDPGAACDQRRETVDRPVPDLALLVVGGVP